MYVLLGFLVKGDSICSPFKEETDNVGDDKICLETLSKEGTLGWLAGTTVVCLLFLFLFFLTIKRDQWKTYFENESSRNYNIRTGWHNEDDGQKVESLLKHSSLTPPVEEVREWMESNWVEWENENPSWFHHYRQTMIFVLKEVRRISRTKRELPPHTPNSNSLTPLSTLVAGILAFARNPRQGGEH